MTGFKLIDKVRIDVVSDVMCPWCMIGYKRLELAISELGLQKHVEIVWQPFELNADIPEEGEDVQAHISRKYGTDAEGWQKSRAHMVALGEEVGFKFDYFEGMRMANTLDAHVLIEFAKEHGKQTDMNLRLMTSHFIERKNVSMRDVLLDEVAAVGLDRNAAEARLKDDTARQVIKEQIAMWHNRGVHSVPTIIFNDKSALVGAQSVAVYKQVLTDMFESEDRRTSLL